MNLILNEKYEKVSPENPFNLKHTPLYHQMRTYNALKDKDLVINTYNTGTGKTNASLFHLFDIKDEDINVLFIAPTNELIRQHQKDIENFVKENNLDFITIDVNAKTLNELDYERNPKTLTELIQNTSKYKGGEGKNSRHL